MINRLRAFSGRLLDATVGRVLPSAPIKTSAPIGNARLALAKRYIDDLPRIRAELASARAQAAELNEQVRVLEATVHSIYEIARRYGLGVEEPDEVGPEAEPRHGGEAVLAVMQERPGVWRARDVHEALVRRGWISPDIAHPAEATGAAINRLMKAGQIERLGRGRYRIIAS
jgi:hypothetical protein